MKRSTIQWPEILRFDLPWQIPIFLSRPGVQGIGFLVHPSDKKSVIESKSRRRIDPSRKKFGIGLPFQFTRFSFQGVKPTVGRSDENQITFADCRRGVNFSARFKFHFLAPVFPSIA